MAKKKKSGKPETPPYSELIRSLRERGPERLYMLWGEEDYLRDGFCDEIRKLCFQDGGEDFAYHRLVGLQNLDALREAVDCLPFCCERTLTEVRDAEVNNISEQNAAELLALIADLPEYCTLVLLLPTGGEPDSRRSFVKAVKKYGSALEFQAQSEARLINWVGRRFASFGKRIDAEQARYLIFRSGSLMNTLIPEIAKIAAYAKGDSITRGDIDAAAHHLPEAAVFDMSDRLSEGKYDEAAGIMAELLAMRDEPAVKILATIGHQFRRLCYVKLAQEQGLGRASIMSTLNIRYDFIADRLFATARRFSTERLARSIELCADCDYAMKSSGRDDRALMSELLLRLWGEQNA